MNVVGSMVSTIFTFLAQLKKSHLAAPSPKTLKKRTWWDATKGISKGIF